MNNWYKTYNYGVFNDNMTIIRFNALASLFTGGNYFGNLLFINFLSFTGIVALYHWFREQSSLKSRWIILLCFGIPQVWFWSSGLLKEGLLFFGLGLFVYGFSRLLKGADRQSWILSLVGLGFLLMMKIYVFACLIPAVLFWLFREKGKRPLYPFLLVHLGFVLLAVMVDALAYPLLESISGKQMDFIRLGLMGNAGSCFDLPVLESSWPSLLSLAPIALWNSLFRPFWEDCNSLPLYLSWFENIGIAGLCLLGVLSMNRSRLKRSPIFWFGLSFTLLLFVLIGLITPVAGALVRCKIPALPFLLIGSLSLSSFQFLHEEE
jgi:hypothetical protein